MNPFGVTVGTEDTVEIHIKPKQLINRYLKVSKQYTLTVLIHSIIAYSEASIVHVCTYIPLHTYIHMEKN